MPYGKQDREAARLVAFSRFVFYSMGVSAVVSAFVGAYGLISWVF